MQAQFCCLCRQCQHACCPAELPLASEYTFAGTREARPIRACGMRSALFHLMGVSGSSADGLQAYRLADRHVGLPGRRAPSWARQAWDILGHILCQRSVMLSVRASQPAAHLNWVLGCHFLSFAWRRGTLMRHLQLPGAGILPSPTVFISSFQHRRLQAIAQVLAGHQPCIERWLTAVSAAPGSRVLPLHIVGYWWGESSAACEQSSEWVTLLWRVLDVQLLSHWT